MFIITLITFLAMEGITWLTHKYVMHGFLWNLHYDHHNKDKKKIMEKNDWFFLYFAIISMSLFGAGQYNPRFQFCTYIGLGILAYGLAYFIVHEIIIHKRMFQGFRFQTRYFQGLQRAHRAHHRQLGKEHGECFGMLFVPFKYFKSESKDKS